MPNLLVPNVNKSPLTVMVSASWNAYTMTLYILSYNLEALKEVVFLTHDYHNQYYITTAVNNYLQL